MEFTNLDRATIRSIVERQLLAFQNDDAVTAFKFASPGIQSQFGTPENFIRMVKTAYPPVYRPRSVLFEDLVVVEGVLAQPVLLLDSEGTPRMAVYLLEKQPEGNWKINGCYLVPVDRESLE
jgi:hypothetical protein